MDEDNTPQENQNNVPLQPVDKHGIQRPYYGPVPSIMPSIMPPTKNQNAVRAIGITAAVLGGIVVVVGIVAVVLTIAWFALAIYAFNASYPYDATHNTAPSPTPVATFPPSDSSVYVYTGDTFLNLALPSPSWVGPNWGDGAGGDTGYSDVAGACAVAFYPTVDGEQPFNGSTRMSEAELKQEFFINYEDSTIITSPEELAAAQVNYTVMVNDKPMEFLTAPVTREGGNLAWIGVASWPYEQTYVEAVMNCNIGTTPEKAKAIWDQAMSEVVASEG